MPRRVKKSRRKHRALTAGEYVARATMLGGHYNPYLHIIIEGKPGVTTDGNKVVFESTKRYDADTMEELSIDAANERKHMFKPLRDEPKTGGWQKRVWDTSPQPQPLPGKTRVWRDEFSHLLKRR